VNFSDPTGAEPDGLMEGNSIDPSDPMYSWYYLDYFPWLNPSLNRADAQFAFEAWKSSTRNYSSTFDVTAYEAFWNSVQDTRKVKDEKGKWHEVYSSDIEEVNSSNIIDKFIREILPDNLNNNGATAFFMGKKSKV